MMHRLVHCLDRLFRFLTVRVHEKQLERLLHGPSTWEVWKDVFLATRMHVAVAALILLVSTGLYLMSGSDTYLIAGGLLVSFVALVFSMSVNAEADFLDWLFAFTKRLTANERSRELTGFTDVNKLIAKWRQT